VVQVAEIVSPQQRLGELDQYRTMWFLRYHQEEAI